MLVHNLLENSTSQYPDKIAVIQDDLRVAYHQLDTRATRLAVYLGNNGLNKGDRVAILLENGIDYIVAYYATMKIGAVAAPLNPGLKPDQLEYLINDLEPTAIITNYKSERLIKATPVFGPALKVLVIRNPKQKWDNAPIKVSSFDDAVNISDRNRELSNISSGDLASIIYTSGSTGKPKGVMLSHRNIVTNTNSICQYLSLTEEDIQMVVLPFFYVMGKSLLNTHIASGGTVIINNGFMYPANVVHQMIKEKVTGFSGVPSTYAYLLNRSPLETSKEKLNHLRYCSQAGGHMAKTIKIGLRKVLPSHTQIFTMYGATEAAARLTYLEPEKFESKIDSIGKPIPDVTIRIIDEDGNERFNGEEGELIATGPNIMMGYWKKPKDTAHVLTKKGYHTGDIGYRDPEGFLYIVRRKDGLLKVGGHRINPTEIEEFLMATELLVESAVVGLPDKLLGTKLMAIVVTKEDSILAKNIHKVCASGLPKHKNPAQIITVRSLPKTANGKIDRKKCIQISSKKQPQ